MIILLISIPILERTCDQNKRGHPIPKDSLLLVNGYCYDQSIPSGPSSYTASDLYFIDSCNFLRTAEYSGNGGVISYDGNINTKMSVSNSMFYNCSVSGIGGAIYFRGGDLYLTYICSRGGSSGVYCHFAYLFVASSTKENFIRFVSMVDCSFKSNNKNYGIRIMYGYQKLSSSNLSMNYANKGSSIYFESPTYVLSSYNTISNNEHRIDGGFMFEGGSLYSNFSYINFIGNQCPSSCFSLYNLMNEVFIVNSIFIDNGGTLFRGDSHLVICGCFISHSSSISSKTVETTNCSLGMVPSYILTHFESYHCPTYFPPRTPINTYQPTLPMTLSMTYYPTQIPTISSTIQMTNQQTPIPTISDTFDQTLDETPIRTPEITLNPTISYTLFQTIPDSPIPTISDTIFPTISDTLFPTMADTPYPTISDTICPTISETLYQTVSDTLFPTIADSFYPTISNTLWKTIEETIKDTEMPSANETLNPTPDLTETNKSIGTNVYAAFIISVFVILILCGMIYGFQFIMMDEVTSSDIIDSI